MKKVTCTEILSLKISESQKVDKSSYWTLGFVGSSIMIKDFISEKRGAGFRELPNMHLLMPCS